MSIGEWRQKREDRRYDREMDKMARRRDITNDLCGRCGTQRWRHSLWLRPERTCRIFKEPE